MIVSPDGTDEPQCLDSSIDTTCKTLHFPINQGVSSLCLHGIFYNMSEHIQSPKGTITQATEINIFCKDCSLINSKIVLSCNVGRICRVFLINVIVKDSSIWLKHIYVTLSNVTLEQSLVKDFPHFLNKGNMTFEKPGMLDNHIQIEDSILSCFEPSKCGLYLTHASATKLVFVLSYLKNFRLEISVSQLIFICHGTHIIMPRVKVNIRSFEYLKIPAIIEFDQVRVVRNRAKHDKGEMSSKIKRNVETEPREYYITFDLTNPYVIIKGSHFIGINLQIQSKRQEFEPVFFSVSFERNLFINSHFVGDGGGLQIISEVRHSEVKLLNCIFSNNSAVKGKGTMKGQGGGLYIRAQSLRLIMTDCTFADNRASDLGLGMYTTEGVDTVLTNCTFQYSVDPNSPIQQSLFFVFGNILQFGGVFQVFNPKPESYVGPIDVFYIAKGANLKIETYCPKWYNHVTEYTAVSTESQIIPDVKYKCIPCSDNYYTVFMESKTLSYDGKENISLAEKLNRNKGTYSCKECPYGALCTGNNVMPRPNYWGYWYESKLVFQQCPAGYCCSGSESSTCNVFDHCPGNRSGTLCGACKEGFSMSILTGACTPDNQCGGDQWFWLVALVMTMIYALWYTLKNDICSLAFSTITIVKRICKQPTSKVIKIHVEMEEPSRERPSIQNSQLQDIGRAGSHTSDKVDNTQIKEVKVEGQNDNDDVDKGYFSIVTYYVQMAAVIMIQIEFSDIDKSESFLDQMVNNIGRLLNIELTQMAFDVCPIVGLTTVRKYMYKLMFLVGIYVSWTGFFIIIMAMVAMLHKYKIIPSFQRNFESFRLKLIRGVIEIIKYTYAGFCSIIFMSLVCAQIGNKYVWWYDGTNICLENWQILIVIFAAFYAIPFPLALILGLKLLKQNKISPTIFICSCLCPLIAVYFMLIYGCIKRKDSKIAQQPVLSKESEVIISVLQGPYRDDEKHQTLYWEAMVSVRRLLITGMTLVSYASIRLIIITALGLIFQIQHIYMSPFLVRTSNDVETVSLTLLVLTSVINLLKASLTDSGVVPSGPSVSFFKSIELCEKMFVLIIIAYILLVELRLRKGKKIEY